MFGFWGHRASRSQGNGVFRQQGIQGIKAFGCAGNKVLMHDGIRALLAYGFSDFCFWYSGIRVSRSSGVRTCGCQGVLV